MAEGSLVQRARIAGWLSKLRSGGVLLALIEVVLVASVLSPAFYQPSNIFIQHLSSSRRAWRC